MDYQKKIAQSHGYGFFCNDTWLNNHPYCKEAILNAIFYLKKNDLENTKLYFFVKPDLLAKVFVLWGKYNFPNLSLIKTGEDKFTNHYLVDFDGCLGKPIFMDLFITFLKCLKTYDSLDKAFDYLGALSNYSSIKTVYNHILSLPVETISKIDCIVHSYYEKCGCISNSAKILQINV